MSESAIVFIVGAAHRHHSGGHGKGYGVERTCSPDAQMILSSSGLLKRALLAAGVNDAFADTLHAPMHHKVMGIARLCPGVFYETALTAFTDEELLCWKLFRGADDVFSACVQDVACASVPLDAEFVSESGLIIQDARQSPNFLFPCRAFAPLHALTASSAHRQGHHPRLSVGPSCGHGGCHQILPLIPLSGASSCLCQLFWP